MNAVTLRYKMEADAILIEVEGFKAENVCRADRDAAPAYDEKAFFDKAEQLNSVMNALHLAIQNGDAQ